jgi:hypothetical protein
MKSNYSRNVKIDTTPKIRQATAFLVIETRVFSRALRSASKCVQSLPIKAEINEILFSQQKMLTRRNEKSALEDVVIEKQFEHHLGAIRYWRGRQPNIDAMYVQVMTCWQIPASITDRARNLLVLR